MEKNTNVKIIDRTHERLSFAALCAGDYFWYLGELYLKTEEDDVAIDLDTGVKLLFQVTDFITPVNKIEIRAY